MYFSPFRVAMSDPLFVMVKRGTAVLLPKTVLLSSRVTTFYELAEMLAQKHCDFNLDDICNVMISSLTESKESISVSKDSLSLPLSTGIDIGMSMVTFYLQVDGLYQRKDTTKKVNAFSELMRVDYIVPKKIATPQSGPERLYNQLIDWVVKQGACWKMDVVASGERLLRALRNGLWYIESSHDKLIAQGCSIPKDFEKYANIRDWKQMKKRAPKIESQRLTDLIEDLATCLNLPSSSSQRLAKIMPPIDNLLQSLIKYKKHLNQEVGHKMERKRWQLANEDDSMHDTTTTTILPTHSVKPMYLEFDRMIAEKELNEYIDLDPYLPEDRIDRRKYINDIQLSVCIVLYRVAFGGALGTHNFAWRVDEGDNLENNVKVVSAINASLPKYSSRAAKKKFIDNYASHVKVPKNMLRQMFYELTGVEPSPEHSRQATIDERTAEFLLESDDPEIILDYRSLNGKRDESKFDPFYQAVESYFEKQLLAVHERRHDEQLYLPLALSMEDLKREVTKELQEETPIPSTEMLRLQFHPANIYRKDSVRYTGRFNVKYTVQSRMSRVSHPDAKYVAVLFKYLKEFCVKYTEEVLLVCLDDKAIVPVGEPGHPVSTGVRAHNRVLAPVDQPIQCLDHDFHVAGLVPSVSLICEIPENASDSFFCGQAYITTKDKVFEPSNPLRHAAELVQILWNDQSDDGVSLNKPVLALFTDGGPDHRPTFESVKLSLLSIFIQLDLDMLVAIRTAPNNSWVNLAERVMPLLNLALQHCSLQRDVMPDNMEKKMKNKGSLSAVLNCAEVTQGFKEVYAESMRNVSETANRRFQRMFLKEKQLKTMNACSQEEIEDMLQPIKLLTGCEVLNSKSTSKEIRSQKELMHFMDTHSKSSEYSFQLKKCQSNHCQYCSFLVKQTAVDFHYIPDPQPQDGSDSHTYKSFETVGHYLSLFYCSFYSCLLFLLFMFVCMFMMKHIFSNILYVAFGFICHCMFK